MHATPERRVDPEDGQARTFEELRRLCAGLYSESEIMEYWEAKCRLAEGYVDEQFSVDVQLQERPRQSQAGARLLPPWGDDRSPARAQPLEVIPFQSAPARDYKTMAPAAIPVDVQKDAALASHRHRAQHAGESYRGASRQRAAKEATPQAQRWPEDLHNFMGDGDHARDAAALKALVLAPWCLFAGALLLWAALQQPCKWPLCALLTALLCAASVSPLALWCLGRRHCGPAPALPLAALCLLAVAAGTGAGELAWARHWRQYWWLRTGRRPERALATTPAAAYLDAAVLGFATAAVDDGAVATEAEGEAAGARGAAAGGGAAVDPARAAGHRQGGHSYCVAPVLSPRAAGAGLARVNYWAIGIDCCQALGSFTCDDAREQEGAYGMVMLGAGYPCPGCNAAKFHAAVVKAEKMHGLVSDANALFVRWVRDPWSVTWSVFWEALFFLVLALLFALVTCGVLGSFVWYYGIGKGPSVDAALNNFWPATVWSGL